MLRVATRLARGQWTHVDTHGNQPQMLTALRAQGIARVASPVRGVLAVIALATCSRQVGQTGTQGFAHGSDCRVEVLASQPRSGYVEVGQLSFEAYAAGPARHQYTSSYALAADLRADICAVGGDALVIERNAAGVIVHGTVLRRADVLEVPPPPSQPPSRTELCEPSCSPGFACEGGTCIQQCVPACANGETCGNDRLCYPNH